jgi:acid phosphatase
LHPSFHSSRDFPITQRCLHASVSPESTIQPSGSAISAAQATQTILSPKSNVQGKAFNRFYQVWLENTDYSAASGDSTQKFLASKGITLTNYWAVTHPSEPNYAAVVAGDYFGMENDGFHSYPANISTVVDLLDTKGISWASYQESIPYAGFQGFNYSQQQGFNDSNSKLPPDYVRKHNPLILFESVSSNETRLALHKNFTSFQEDFDNESLPQWAFFTPNMTNDGHDTNVTFASLWEKNFLAPLLNDTDFMNGTLLLLTFDENEHYPQQNKVFTILIGGEDVIPASLKGTVDDTFYTHYSTISTVSVNWDLPSLGRWDCDANVFALVANKTNYKNVNVNTQNLYLNQSYPGPMSYTKYIDMWAVPNTTAQCASGQGVLASVKQIWGNGTETYNYTNVFPYDASSNNNNVPTTTVGGTSGTNTATASPSSSSKASASSNTVSGALVLAMALAAALL